MHEVSVHKLNLVLFSSSLVGYIIAVCLTPASRGLSIPFGAHPHDLFASGVVIILHIAGDFLSLAILRRTQLDPHRHLVIR